MKKNVTMEDIARRVGVHAATVSNVLNNRFDAKRSDAARRAKEIRRVASEMGYRPSGAARATRTGRTGLIGMLRSAEHRCSVHEPRFEFALDDTLHAAGLCLVRDIIEDDVDQPPRIVREYVVDGLIVNYAFNTPGPVRELIDRCQIPAVWVNRRREQNCVRPDDEGAAYLGTQHLLDHGHTDIAFLYFRNESEADREPHYSSADRQQGYIKAMKAAGLTPRVEDLNERLSSEDLRGPGKVHRKFTQWLKRPNRPTAVLTVGYGDVLRLTAEAAGLVVPKDLSIVGFENNNLREGEVAIDRLLNPYTEMGKAAVHEMLALVESPVQERSPVVLPFQFRKTGSVAKLPNSSS